MGCLFSYSHKKRTITQKTDGVVAIIKKHHRFLLIKQNKIPYKNFWGPVHGKIEINESEQEALIRETKEEMGLQVTPIKKLWVSNADYGANKLHWWLAEAINNKITIDPEEIAAYGFFALDELFNLKLLPTTKEFFLEKM